MSDQDRSRRVREHVRRMRELTVSVAERNRRIREIKAQRRARRGR